MDSERPVEFGPFSVDPHTLELTRDGRPVPIEPLPARILLRLARDPGRMVARSELRTLGWPRLPGAAEQSLNTCVHQIRRALDGTGESGVRVETLRGRGYRLVAVDHPAGADGRGAAGNGPDGGGSRRRAASRLALALGGAVAAAGIGLVIVPNRPSADPVGSGPLAATTLPPAAAHMLERAEYLVRETGALEAALAVLDSGQAAYPEEVAFVAEAAELRLMLGEVGAAREHAERAHALDPHHATALRALGGVALVTGALGEAEARFREALAVAPDDARTLSAIAYLEAVLGRRGDAARTVARALEVDPLSAVVHQDAGFTYLLIGRYDERRCEEVLRFKPDSAWALGCLFDAALLAGRTDEAAAHGRRVLARLGGHLPGSGAGTAEVIRRVHERRIELLQAQPGGSARRVALARSYAAVGRVDQALAALREAAAEPGLGTVAIAVDPRLTALHGDPSFGALRAELGLPRVGGAS